jgi:hypothetical protein
MSHRLTSWSEWQLFMEGAVLISTLFTAGMSLSKMQKSDMPVWMTCSAEGHLRVPTDEASWICVDEIIWDRIELFTVLGDPPRSPDLDPSNFHLFPKLIVGLALREHSIHFVTSRERWRCAAAERLHSYVVMDLRTCLTVREIVKRCKLQNKVLFIHQLMHYWVVLKNNIKIYIKFTLM